MDKNEKDVLEINIEENEKEEVIERPYTLRKMKDGDLIPLLSLFRKLGLGEFKEVVQMVSKGASVQEVGIQAILSMGSVVIQHLEGAVGEEIYSFFSDVAGIPVEEMKEMEFGTLPLIIYDCFYGLKNTSFFKVLAKLL